MSYTKVFEKIASSDVDQAGGKGASLGEMTQAGLAVPPGYVILADAFDRFLEETDLGVEIASILDTVNTEAIHTIDEASEKIQGLIMSAVMPDDIAKEVQSQFDQLGADYVAVRSSATAEDSASAAWAGQLDTFLNTTQERLLRDVQRCWASLFTPRAIYYRFEQGLENHHISVAVVVQKMIQSETSGIAFSVHPVTQDRNQMIIEAGFGLGEAIVSGSITPDAYVVQKDTLEILDVNVNVQNKKLVLGSDPLQLPLRKGESRVARPFLTKEGIGEVSTSNNQWIELASDEAEAQVLSESQIIELAELIKKIEDHYGFPCDIEWAYENGKFYITQSRPITTLGSFDKEKSNVSKIASRNWQKDWEGPFSLLQVSLGEGVYFSKPQEFFGSSLDSVLLVIKNGIMSAYLPMDSYESHGSHLAQLVIDDEAVVDRWCDSFVKTADGLTALIKNLSGDLTDQDTLAKLKEVYSAYGAYQISTKAVINFLPDRLYSASAKKFEKARRYSETIYKDAEDLINLMVKHFTGGNDRAYSTLTIDELVACSVSLDEAKQRYIKSGVYLTPGNTLILNADEVDRIKQGWKNLDTGILKGTTAYEGIVTGKCRIITNFEDAKIEEGEILVTGMTDPNYVPLMKKAGAIVTDAGGMLSHAAIVSRELKKPCVVGTKCATSVLSSGDIIEVNADQGTVKLLESKKEPRDIYRKAYTRDFSIIIQQAWFYANDEGLEKYHGIEIGQKSPYVFYINDGVVEVWENEAVMWDLMGGVVKKHEENPDYFDKVLERYGRNLDIMRGFWKKPLVDSNAFDQFSNLLYAMMADLVILYHAGFDKRLPKEMQEKARAWRDKDEFFDRSDEVIRSTLIELYPELSRLVTSILLDEVFSVPDKSVLEDRKQHFVLVPPKVANAITIDEFIQSNSDLNFEFEEVPADVQSIEGQVAFKGRVQGTVKVLKCKDQIGEFRKGEILVSPMTTPDFLPAIKKAAAIVTDEGGVICHAAIVARELKKPCIIGSKVATQVLKDGDEVEVNANDGVVRIVK